jgi:hypothetical protein
MNLTSSNIIPPIEKATIFILDTLLQNEEFKKFL